LRIQQNLLVLNGQTINDLTEVHSHPMALLQCQAFFKQYPHIRLVESHDTAASAAYVQEKQLKNIGAIASTLAAECYNLNVLAEGIETNKRNFTRFLVIQHKAVSKPSRKAPNKASVCCRLSHEAGSLVRVLDLFAKQSITLTKIQSLPVVGTEWEYFFHFDLEFNDYDAYQRAIAEVNNNTTHFKVLGEYRTGIKHRTI